MASILIDADGPYTLNALGDRQMRQRTCRICIEDTTEDLTIYSPFDQGFVDAIKNDIPSFARRWEPATKRWCVQEAYSAEAYLACKRYYPKLQIEGLQANVDRLLQKAKDYRSYTDTPIDGPSPVPVIPAGQATYFDILGVAPDATNDEITRGYKRMAPSCHPDTGGDHERWLALQTAYTTLKDEKRRAKYLFGLKLLADDRGGDPWGIMELNISGVHQPYKTNPPAQPVPGIYPGSYPDGSPPPVADIIDQLKARNR